MGQNVQPNENIYPVIDMIHRKLRILPIRKIREEKIAASSQKSVHS